MQHNGEGPRVGFVGLGIMGTPMVGHLADAGQLVAVYDIDQSASAAVVAAHPSITAAGSPAELGALCDIVITMLPNTPDVAGVVSALAASGRAGMLMIDMSTIDPAASRSFGALLAGKGIRFVDAAVGRSPLMLPSRPRSGAPPAMLPPSLRPLAQR